jgi:hypothetical protein
MKHYETSFIDYIKAVNNYNLHEDKEYIFNSLPDNFSELTNLIITGTSGIGKYSQSLKIIEKYSDTGLKYDKKITCSYEKQPYIFKISDIHYEIDISMLGCNSKQLWHEIFFQIIDIVTIKQRKDAIILCKNFHTINSELLDIFYSYMQHNKINPNINLKFIIITEHISFIPYNILNNCISISYRRPSIEKYKKIFTITNNPDNNNIKFLERINKININIKDSNLLNNIPETNIINIKDFKYFNLINDNDDIPEDIFNIVSDKLLSEIINFKNCSLLQIRDLLYDILTYNLDIYECIWYIIYELIDNDYINNSNYKNILNQLYIQFKYYNNNYRPIYHLERIIYNIIINISK